MHHTDLPEFLTAGELAELLRVSPETIRRRARCGEYPSVPGLRVLRFPRDLILQVLYSNQPPIGPR
jgi:hypothetical protein